MQVKRGSKVRERGAGGVGMERAGAARAARRREAADAEKERMQEHTPATTATALSHYATL